MAAAKRDIGQEILQGIRQLKRGEHGRITNYRPWPPYERRPGCHSQGSLNCSAFRFARCRNGNKAAEHLRVQRGRCC